MKPYKIVLLGVSIGLAMLAVPLLLLSLGEVLGL